MRHRRRARTRMEAIDQINVTPLLDLTFLLLIAFMITMPLMEYGTNIKAPEMNSAELPQDNFESVTLTAKGGSDYLWSLSNEEIGSLSSRHGSSVVYTAQVCEGANTFQTVTAQSKLTGGIVTTNGNSLASGTATILHRGSEE